MKREIYQGIDWCDRCEAMYQQALPTFVGRISNPEQEAFWVVKDRMIKEMLAREVKRGLACKTNEQKRALYAEWSNRYGEQTAKNLANYIKNPKMQELIFSWVRS